MELTGKSNKGKTLLGEKRNQSRQAATDNYVDESLNSKGCVKLLLRCTRNLKIKIDRVSV